jgi:hypothetical protein
VSQLFELRSIGMRNRHGEAAFRGMRNDDEMFHADLAVALANSCDAAVARPSLCIVASNCDANFEIAKRKFSPAKPTRQPP